ncbi:choline monooxygenase, chloroplastic [Arachis stenosperma]|uniref:choline monooxygenase, chloroplastic n=1 Tax=Arachis stenosperma TaxID=217475 RepID=UPI0025AD076E|nr:choline monooxygenase, chloroplastic [Arachis stenosperma]
MHVQMAVTMQLTPFIPKLRRQRSSHNLNFHNKTAATSIIACCSARNSSEAEVLVSEFNPKIPIEEAVTPPTSWYTDISFFQLELHRIFYRGWQAVGSTEQIKDLNSFFTGRLGDVEFVVCRDESGKLQAFHNVCRHHASLLASGSGHKSCFVCPYHGWTYGLSGALLKATRISGMRNFNVKDFGLIPIKVSTWGPFILLNLEKESLPLTEIDSTYVAKEWLGSCSEILSTNGIDSPLSYVCRREYTIECNWKVFCDNYLDGGYHVPYAHKGLASGLKFDSYSTTIFERVSIQSCEGSSGKSKDNYDRLGRKAIYAFIYPNFMINRYGPWMDTNLVLPLGPNKCQVVFDYYLEHSLKHDKDFIELSLQDSEKVQIEDIVLCEGVQKGLQSPAYYVGRYAPKVEQAMHHFHCLLYENLKK